MVPLQWIAVTLQVGFHLIWTEKVLDQQRNTARYKITDTEFIIHTGKGSATTHNSKYTAGPVTLSICNLSGKVVASLYKGEIRGQKMIFDIN
jgi:hypothetical protein